MDKWNLKQWALESNHATLEVNSERDEKGLELNSWILTIQGYQVWSYKIIKQLFISIQR